MKRTLILFIFIALAVVWCLVVSGKAVSTGWEPMKAFGLGILGAFWIGAIGLRLVYLIGPPPVKIVPRQIAISQDPLVACQVGHRQPYVSRY